MSKNPIETARELVLKFDAEVGESAYKVGLEKTLANLLPMYDRLIHSIANKIEEEKRESYKEGFKDGAASVIPLESSSGTAPNLYSNGSSYGFGGRLTTKRPPKEELEAVLMSVGGVKMAVARHYSVHPQTVTAWLEKYGMVEKPDDRTGTTETDTPSVEG